MDYFFTYNGVEKLSTFGHPDDDSVRCALLKVPDYLVQRIVEDSKTND
jgi:hypothetical protein